MDVKVYTKFLKRPHECVECISFFFFLINTGFLSMKQKPFMKFFFSRKFLFLECRTRLLDSTTEKPAIPVNRNGGFHLL